MTQTNDVQCCDPQSGCSSEVQSQPQGASLVVQPRVDVLESNDAWLLRAEMPGVDETHAEVSLEQQTLTIGGTAELQEPQGYQRQFGTFRSRRYERAFKLPAAIDRAGLDASVKHGVLTVRIPKAREAQPTKITVRGA
jgi:HSP20 family protein